MTLTSLLSLAGTWYVIAAPIVGLVVWVYLADWFPALCATAAFLGWGAFLVSGAFLIEENGGSN